jgi:uncharacterized protein
MYRQGDRLVLSPSDLVGFLQCGHLTELALEVVDGTISRPRADRSEQSVVQRRGIEHERDYLAQLEAGGLDVIEIDAEGDLGAQVRATVDALATGPDVIYQATFLDPSGPGPSWRGHADFLTKVPSPSSLGNYSYEPEDTKLAGHVRASAVLQLCEYAEQLERFQGGSPELIHVVLGDKTKISLRTAEFAAYFRAAKRRFVSACTDRTVPYPVPVEHCAVCEWRADCDAKRLADDHLSLVPGLRRDQVAKLTLGAGVSTVSELAAFAGDSIPGIGRQALEKLRSQAKLQVEARTHPEQTPPYELLEGAGPGTGFAALPEPSPGDLFFDIEGDPFVGESGLEYLLGVGWVEPGGEFGFKSFWAHTPSEEKASFEAFMDFVALRQAARPDLHIFHYAPYERTALGKLMGRYGTRETEVDNLFRSNTLVDLYRVVKQALRAGTPSYSLKKLEVFYMGARTQAITDAGSSIDEYERWLETGDDTILEDIEEYNRIDCDSTRLLRGWLEERRDEYGSQFGELPTRPAAPNDEIDQQSGEDTENDVLKRLLDDADRTGSVSNPEDTGARQLLGNLLDWYRREAKPVWWEYFHRVHDCDGDDLYEDAEAIAGLEYLEAIRTEKRSTVHRYSFDPDQEFKFATGDRPVDPAAVRWQADMGESIPSPGELVDLDAEGGFLELKRATNSTAPDPRELIPGGPIRTDPQEQALRRVAASVIEHGIDGVGPYRAVRDLLLRRPPRTEPGCIPGEPLVDDGEEGARAVVRLGRILDHSCLAIQGPPGSGKTRAASHLAVELIRDGRTVGITANGHAVITNLVDAVCELAAQEGVDLRASQKSDGVHQASHGSVTHRTDNDAILGDLENGSHLIAGTAWMFAREQFDQKLDYLIVDEAGQFSLANAVAIGTAAKNVVLLGDPMQLAQPIKGTHPSGAGASALGHVLGKAETLPDDLGLFLELTHRLHPDICTFISEAFYEERLRSAADLERQRIDDAGALSGTGLRWRPVEHSGNRVDSPEEAMEVLRCYEQLLGSTFTDRKGKPRTVGSEDILVVAPYNAQVRRLRQVLPEGALIGTVDRFQGQQAPAVICSMTTSSVEEIPRGMEFLLSRNRLNVAVSRAQALAVVVGSPNLLTVTCRSVEQLRMANGLCRFVELST